VASGGNPGDQGERPEGRASGRKDRGGCPDSWTVGENDQVEGKNDRPGILLEDPEEVGIGPFSGWKNPVCGGEISPKRVIWALAAGILAIWGQLPRGRRCTIRIVPPASKVQFTFSENTDGKPNRES